MYPHWALPTAQTHALHGLNKLCGDPEETPADFLAGCPVWDAEK